MDTTKELNFDFGDTLSGIADLHSHTVASDGKLTAKELIELAQRRYLRAIAITDHDTCAGVREGLDENRKETNIGNFLIIPGIEVTCIYEKKEIHVLGLFVNPYSRIILQHEDEVRRKRVERIERMTADLQRQGIQITTHDVLSISGNGIPGRAHLAQALVNLGVVATNGEAFAKYIGNSFIREIATEFCDVQEGIRRIHKAGGVAVLAHPARFFGKPQLKELKSFGLDGIEITHPSHDHIHIRRYRQLAVEIDFVESGGSDFHGGRKFDELNIGKYTLPFAKVKLLYDYKKLKNYSSDIYTCE